MTNQQLKDTFAKFESGKCLLMSEQKELIALVKQLCDKIEEPISWQMMPADKLKKIGSELWSAGREKAKSQAEGRLWMLATDLYQEVLRHRSVMNVELAYGMTDERYAEIIAALDQPTGGTVPVEMVQDLMNCFNHACSKTAALMVAHLKYMEAIREVPV